LKVEELMKKLESLPPCAEVEVGGSTTRYEGVDTEAEFDGRSYAVTEVLLVKDGNGREKVWLDGPLLGVSRIPQLSGLTAHRE
jgi:hypothetical protein